MSRESSLPRKKGRLTAVSQTLLGGQKAFVCECSCRRASRTVTSKQFDRGNVTCCERCVADGVRPDLHAHNPKRTYVSLDPDAFALLGLDLEVEGNRSGATVREILREYALLVREAGKKLTLTPNQWGRLWQEVQEKPGVLGNGWPAVSQVTMLAEGASLKLPYLTTIQTVAIVAALKWKADHPDAIRWWEPGVRTGDE